MRGLVAARRADDVAAGTRPLAMRTADHNAPMMMTIAGTPDPTAASTRGVVPKSSFAVGNSLGSTPRFIGAIATTPVAQPDRTSKPVRTASPVRRPNSR